MANRIKLTPQKKKEFLEFLSDEPNVTSAAHKIGMTRAYMYQVRAEEPAFAAGWEAAVNEALDKVEAELYRRAVTGYSEPVFYQGQEVSTVRKFSDVLLIFWLKAYRPEKFRERVEVGNIDGKPIHVVWDDKESSE